MRRKKILLRAHKSPFTVLSAEQTYLQDAIGSNVGNLVFSDAAYRVLSRRDVEITTSPGLTTKRRAWERGPDHVVIPLANAFRNSFRHKLDAMSERIETLRTPVSVLGVGAQGGLGGSFSRLDDLAGSVRRFVGAVLDRSPSIGVRGESTRRYLAALGFGDEHVTVIGCPSMFRRGSELVLREPVQELTAQSPVAVNVSPYVAEMASIVKANARRYSRLVYFAQDIHTLALLLGARYAGQGRETKNPVSSEHRLYREGRMLFCLDPSTWFAELARRDFSFGTRIHGNIAAILAGTPAVVLTHDSRTLELARYFEIPSRRITKVSSKVDPAKLLEHADWGPMLRGHAGRWDTFEQFLHQHGLRHAFEAGGAAQEFDAHVADVPWEAPVRPPEYSDRPRHVSDAVVTHVDRILGHEESQGMRQG